MINLLPPDTKETLLYARRNLTLVKWVSAFFVGIVGVGAVIFAGGVYINRSVEAYETDVKRKKEQLVSQQLAETQKHTEDISTSTKLALDVLSRQVLVPDLLRQIGAVIPSGAVLQSLNISKLEGGIDLQVIATDYQTATQVQVNLADPANKIFAQADIINVTCNTETADASSINARYPCQVVIRALFTDESQFQFARIPPESKEAP